MGHALRVGDAGEGSSASAPTAVASQEATPVREEGLSLILRAHPQRSVATLTLPVSMAKRMISGVLRGVPLDLTKGVRSPQHPAYKHKQP